MISVIGAGPAGCYYASKVKNEDVQILEEHKEIGKPISCTGVVSNSINNLIKIPDKAIVNRLKSFSIYSPDNNSINIRLKHPEYIINRQIFDNHIADLARDNGAKIYLNEKLKSIRLNQNNISLKTSKNAFNTDMLVGADGPKSIVAQKAGLSNNRKFAHGLQSLCRYKSEDINETKVFLDKGCFGWIVPEDEKIARIGSVSSDLVKAREQYKNLVSKNKVIQGQSGLIPLYQRSQRVKMNKQEVYLIGDAASQVKQTTYGGIIYGMMAGKMLAEDKGSYVRNVKKGINSNLNTANLIRHFIDKMENRDINKLISMLSDSKAGELLSTEDRNYPTAFMTKMLLKEPRLIGLGLKLLF